MDYALRINTGIIVAVCTFLRYVKMCLCFCRRARRVPPATEQLLTLSATKLAEKIRNKEVTSYELVSTYVNRIKLVNPIINAVAEDRFAEALKEAKEVDALLEKDDVDVEALKKSKPLLGIPVTIKENLQVKGLSATMCCQLYKDVKADEDGEATNRLSRAGAIILLVSTTPEFCLTIETYSKLYGVTRNPYNTLRSVGGSSGGEGALLGAGASLIGLGSDLAGSIRYPSAFNGVFGHKPSHGFISTKGHIPPLNDPLFAKYTVVGPMARYAEDIPLMMKVVCDRVDELRLDEQVDTSKLRIYYMTDCGMNFGLMKVQPEIKRAVTDCVELLRDTCKVSVVEKKFPKLGYASEICSMMAAQINFDSPLKTKDREYGILSQLFLNLFGRSQFSAYIMIHEIVNAAGRMTTGPEKIAKYTKILNELRDEMSTELKESGIFIYPAFAATALREGEFMFMYAGLAYSFIINILGFPTITVPVGFDSSGLPVAVQIVANTNQDRLCFAVAKELQNIFGGWKSP